jgi:hypothetical protein
VTEARPLLAALFTLRKVVCIIEGMVGVSCLTLAIELTLGPGFYEQASKP